MAGASFVITYPVSVYFLLEQRIVFGCLLIEKKFSCGKYHIRVDMKTKKGHLVGDFDTQGCTVIFAKSCCNDF